MSNSDRDYEVVADWLPFYAVLKFGISGKSVYDNNPFERGGRELDYISLEDCNGDHICMDDIYIKRRGKPVPLRNHLEEFCFCYDD